MAEFDESISDSQLVATAVKAEYNKYTVEVHQHTDDDGTAINPLIFSVAEDNFDPDMLLNIAAEIRELDEAGTGVEANLAESNQ
jgi:hypothetical protein